LFQLLFSFHCVKSCFSQRTQGCRGRRGFFVSNSSLLPLPLSVLSVKYDLFLAEVAGERRTQRFFVSDSSLLPLRISFHCVKSCFSQRSQGCRGRRGFFVSNSSLLPLPLSVLSVKYDLFLAEDAGVQGSQRVLCFKFLSAPQRSLREIFFFSQRSRGYRVRRVVEIAGISLLPLLLCVLCVKFFSASVPCVKPTSS